MSRLREGSLLFWLSLVAGVVLTVLALPEAWRPFRPFWLGLLVIWWSLEAPDRMGLGVAFLLGLTQDILIGTLLGEHSFRLVAIAFILLRFRARLRFFPMWQQALAVLAILINDRIVTWALRSFAGATAIDWQFWIAPIVGAMLWPWLFLLLDDLRRRSRPRES
jgi:rod shape-determining protein MreD